MYMKLAQSIARRPLVIKNYVEGCRSLNENIRTIHCPCVKMCPHVPLDNNSLDKKKETNHRVCTDTVCELDNVFKTGGKKAKIMFKVSDYDGIGFDLDNTILQYKVMNLVTLEYDLIAKYMVETKGYNADFLLKPLSIDIDFFQKGLVMDCHRGNVVKLGVDGTVLKASHGSRFMSKKEIEECYGVDRKWDIGQEFWRDMIGTWNGPLSETIRSVPDYFDMSVTVAFARSVDSLDEKNGCKLEKYHVYPDLLDGLRHLFNVDHFASNEGGFFPALKANPEKYLNKCSEDVIKWIQRVKKNKTTFLITGSAVDYASFTSEYVLGKNWRSLFDIVICHARKPGFFTGERPFLEVEGLQETANEVTDVKLGGSLYCGGNWNELSRLMSNKTKHMNREAKYVYFGDNLMQDIYTPSSYTSCETVAVVQELASEAAVHNVGVSIEDSPVIVSKCWGSYFGDEKNVTMWDTIIRKHSKICIPTLEVIANLPLDQEIQGFAGSDIKPTGYYPFGPSNVAKL